MGKKVTKLLAVLFAALSILTAMSFCAAASGSSYIESTSETMYVTAGSLNVRMSYSSDSTVIGTLSYGDKVTVVGRVVTDGVYNGWYQVSFYGGSGFVYSAYLSYSPQGSSSGGSYYTVYVSSSYLALRSAPYYDASNEIGKLYSGASVQAVDKSYGDYWYVYVPSYGSYGYVNKNYLYSGSGSSSGSSSSGSSSKGSSSSSSSYRTVYVSSSYLALRTNPSFDASNEIGKLYSGDTVQIIDTSNGTYWYVYSTRLNSYGYVNASYLY